MKQIRSIVMIPDSVTVNRDEWCWNEKTSMIEVIDRDVTDVTFTQSGYVFSCSLSHDVTLVGCCQLTLVNARCCIAV